MLSSVSKRGLLKYRYTATGLKSCSSVHHLTTTTTTTITATAFFNNNKKKKKHFVPLSPLRLQLRTVAGQTTMPLLSHAERVEAAKQLMDAVYGPYPSDPQQQQQGEEWHPKPYAEGKGRYLWTDAFGVINYINLHYEHQQQRPSSQNSNTNPFLTQARILIDAVHEELGRERHPYPGEPTPRRLVGATNDHPTRGGLRIGKPGEEWERDGDGQYFHYNTKWAFALNQFAKATGETRYSQWAVELLEVSHRHFVALKQSAQAHMCWKISVDMTRPVVLSEGNLDPFDGLVTYKLVADTAFVMTGKETPLVREIGDMHIMVERKYRGYYSSDPLDLGEALWLAHWELDDDVLGGGGGGGEEEEEEEERRVGLLPVTEESPLSSHWAKIVSIRSAMALDGLWDAGYFHASFNERLAFREFGATLGLQVNTKVVEVVGREVWEKRVDDVHKMWMARGQVFKRDADITPVMLCSSLVPGVWKKGAYGDGSRAAVEE
jgi:hypothetical protein